METVRYGRALPLSGSTDYLEIFLTTYTRRRGVDSIGAAGREIAAVNILPWHTKIKAAQEAYLLHNYAWQAYMQSAAEDPVALTVDQPLVNQSFEDAQEPLESVVPVVALFDLEARVANIFIDGAPQSNGEII